MSDFFVVVDKLEDWAPYHPSEDVITFDDYLHRTHKTAGGRVRVIVLSRRYKYLGTGYYCSLLAEARGHHVLPSVRTLNDLGRKELAVLQMEDMESVLAKLPPAKVGDLRVFRCWFGECLDPELAPIAQAVFKRFPCPTLEVEMHFKKQWRIDSVKAVSLNNLEGSEEQEAFAQAFEKFSTKLWRRPKARKSYRYDLAILVDPEEKMPPSDDKALKNFIRAAGQLGIEAELIQKKDYMRLPEYDGLFIRATTSVDHHTYRFAKKAEAEDMVVIDDPTSILRCTNKIYLADLLQTHKIPTPRTEIINGASDEALRSLVEKIGYPMVLKIPDGSFSRGVVKVENWEQLKEQSKSLLKNSSLLLAQEFVFTGYDWRIGVLNNKPLYACRYYMVNDHWQIYKHSGEKVVSGGYDTLPTFEAPKAVLDIATRATRLIGNGFYGVDIKQSGDRVVIIEVNDNPSIESGVEDKYLGDQLYVEIMQEFLRRMASRRGEQI